MIRYTRGNLAGAHAYIEAMPAKCHARRFVGPPRYLDKLAALPANLVG